MLYKFDILVRKELKRGGVKVVSYSHLLKTPDAFGVGETLDGAIGTLPLTEDGSERGCSLSTLVSRYHSQFIGHHNLEVFGTQFPLRFVFEDGSDVASIRAEVQDEEGNIYPFKSQTLKVEGAMTLDLINADFIVALIPQDGECVVSDADSKVPLILGQLVLIPATVKTVTVQGYGEVKSIKCI